jgi:hypothetical protein
MGQLARAPLLVLTALSVWLRPAAAEAGSGGIVTAQRGGIGADAQRIFISVRRDSTDVVTQIVVPEAAADYAVLIPVPALPTLDPTPVATEDLATLDARTAPLIQREVKVEDEGCACFPVCCTADDRELVPARDINVQLTEPVPIGPVTAVVLSADAGAIVQGWLDDNGFALADEDRELVTEYSGPGKFFIAIRRSDTTTSGPSSIGVHFTLPGDQRALPLRFARIGAAPTLAFTVFVAAPSFVAPSPPFVLLRLSDLDGDLVDDQGYAAAVEAAVAPRSGRAFVLEKVLYSGWRRLVTSRLVDWADSDAKLTRLSTRLAAADLTTDVAFDVPYEGGLGFDLILRAPATDVRGSDAGALFALALLARWRRRHRAT